jgi:GNAT superfamily N-acetyltransferase
MTTKTSLPETWAPRSYRPGDDEAILSVFQSAFPKWPPVDTGDDVAPLDHLRWKMNSHPIAKQFFMIGEVDGVLASPRIVIAQPVRVKGQPLLSFQPTDIAVAPEYRGLGITERMLPLEWRLITTERYMQAFAIKLYVRGWTAAHKVIRPRIGVSGHAYGNRFIALERPNTPPPSAAADAGCTLRRISAFDDRIDPFWEEASRPFYFAIDRSQAYLNWRFDHRAGHFDITLGEHDGRVLGYIVTRVNRGIGYIADLIALPERLDVARSLLVHGLGALHGTAASHIECWLPTRHPYREVLRDLGFERAERKLRFRYTPVGLSRDQLEPLRRYDTPLHLTASDTDLI